MTTTSRSLLLGLAVLAVSFVPSCGGGDTCVQAKCASGAWMHIPLGTGASGLVGSTVTVCWNDTECHTAVLPEVPPPGGAGASLIFPNTAYLLGTLWQKTDQSIGLDIEWHASGAVQDGDHYLVKLTSAAGVDSVLLDRNAVYSLSPSTPEECSDSARCSIAELTP